MDELFALLPVWVQCEEAPDGAVVGDSADGVVVTDEELLEAGVVDALLVAALATAVPPPMRTPAIPTAASVCRSRIFIAFTSLLTSWGLLPAYETHRAASPFAESPLRAPVPTFGSTHHPVPRA
jgi:hypothetical protein